AAAAAELLRPDGRDAERAIGIRRGDVRRRVQGARPRQGWSASRPWLGRRSERPRHPDRDSGRGFAVRTLSATEDHIATMKPGRKSRGMTRAGVSMAAAAGVFAAATAVLAGPASRSHQADAEGVSRSVWSGVYTDMQARRGHGAYLDDCVKCHGENLMGGDDAAPLAGEAFASNWDGRTVSDLFDKIRLTMPDDD